MDAFLMDVAEDKVFYLGDKKIKNLYGLLFELRSISDETYSYYAGEDHNYFSDWIEYVIKNYDLAHNLRKTNSRKEAVGLLEHSIDSMKHEEKKEEPRKLVENVSLGASGFNEMITGGTKQAEKLLEALHHEPKELTLERTRPAERVTAAEKEMHDISRDKDEAKEYLWKHFSWEMAKEFMYGMALGILIGLVLSKIFFRV